MANFTQNVSGVVNCFGIQPSTKYGSIAKFGTDLFGDGGNTNFNMPTRSLGFNNDTGPSFLDTSSYNRFYFGPTVNIATFMQNAISETLYDNSSKYKYVLPGGATNDENAFTPVYVNLGGPTNSWSKITTSTITWTVGT